MSSVFSKIIRGEISAYTIGETDTCYAFLDINPLHEGHTLVIPKTEIDYIFDIAEPTYHQLFTFARQVSHAIADVIPCKRIGMAVIGLEVPHAHIHLVPLHHVGDINFMRTDRPVFSRVQFENTRAKIRAALLQNNAAVR